MAPPAPSFSRRQGFTLIELLVVIAVIVTIMAFALPSLNGLGGSSLKAGSRQVSNLLTVARSKAIAERTLYGVGVVIDDPDNPDANYHAIDMLFYNKKMSTWERVGLRENLPEGVYIYPTEPTFLGSAQYASDDPGLTVGDYYPELNVGDDPSVTNSTITYGAVFFKPGGTAKLENGNNRNIYLVLVRGVKTTISPGLPPNIVFTDPADSTGATPSNWAHIITDSLTGRVRNYQP